MNETPQEHANRLLEYCLKATKPVNIHDSNLEPISKTKDTTTQTTQEVSFWDLAIKETFDKGYPGRHNFKPEPLKKAVEKKRLHPLEQMVEDFENQNKNRPV